MKDKVRPYRHEATRAGTGGDERSAETEHRDTARPSGDQAAELDIERRNREDAFGPRTHQATRIDPDPLEESEARESGKDG